MYLLFELFVIIFWIKSTTIYNPILYSSWRYCNKVDISIFII